VSTRTLIAGIGNVFLGDDGFGCEVVRRLDDLAAEPDVRVVDYGIRGMHLTFDLLDGWDLVVLIDALPARGEPGAVEVLDVAPGVAGVGSPDAHGMDPMTVLAGAAAMGAKLTTTCVVGAQVLDVAERMGLTEPMAAAVGPAADAVRALVRQHRATGEPADCAGAMS
jgi:hydrogenase maturation protease